MGIFDWLKKRKSNVDVLDDVIWLSKQAKSAGISASTARCLSESRPPFAVLLVAMFQDCFDELQAVVERSEFDRQRVVTTMAGQLSGRSMTSTSPDDSQTIEIIVAERHPLQAHNAAITEFAESLPCRCRLVYHVSLTFVVAGLIAIRNCVEPYAIEVIESPDGAVLNYFDEAVYDWLFPVALAGGLGILPVWFVLNQLTDMTVRKAWAQSTDSPCHIDGLVYAGGPCGEFLTALHTDHKLSNIEIAPNLHYTQEPAKLARLIERQADPIKFFVGFAGCDKGQLEAELTDGSWLTTPVLPEHVFAYGDELWLHLIREIYGERTISALKIKRRPDELSSN